MNFELENGQPTEKNRTLQMSVDVNTDESTLMNYPESAYECNFSLKLLNCIFMERR